jgi:hypothetical protein
MPAAGWCLPVQAHWCLRSRPYVHRSGARTSKRPIKSSSQRRRCRLIFMEGPGRLRMICLLLLLLRARCSLCCCAGAAVAAVAAVASIATKTAATGATARTVLLLLLLLPCLFASCLLLHLLPHSTPHVRCSFFAFSSCSFSTPCPFLPPRLLLLFLFSSCCFLAFGRFSLVPSEGPLISDQLRRGLLLFLRYFSHPCSPPPLPPPGHCLTTSRCLHRQLFPTSADNKSFNHTYCMMRHPPPTNQSGKIVPR